MPRLHAPLTISILIVFVILAVILYVPARILGYVLLSVGPVLGFSAIYGLKDF